MNSKLLKLIDTLSLPLDNPAARRALRDFAADVGFRYFAQLNLRGSESFAVSNYPARWQRIYVARKFMRVDPVVTHAKHGPSIFTWSADEARQMFPGGPVSIRLEIGSALDEVLCQARPADVIVVLGSVYVVAEARPWLLARRP